jgi:hypothetical protein
VLGSITVRDDHRQTHPAADIPLPQTSKEIGPVKQGGEAAIGIVADLTKPSMDSRFQGESREFGGP